MRRSSGMRPQDIIVLLKIVAKRNRDWKGVDLARELFISQSEVSEALDRNKSARLISSDKKEVNRGALLEFLVSGLKYVFPVEPGGVELGIATGPSAKPLSLELAQTGDVYVWPYQEGVIRGQSITPLYPTAPKAAAGDQAFYELLVLVDALRIGKSRDIVLAKKELEKRLGSK